MTISKEEFAALPFDEVRRLLGAYLHGPNGSSLWDVMAVVRGPDAPSERPDMERKAAEDAYRGRRERKRRTGEVLRGAMFFGAHGGCARTRTDITYVTLPPRDEWDHYDKHVARAADILGLEVKFLDRPKEMRVKTITAKELIRESLAEIEVYLKGGGSNTWFKLSGGGQIYGKPNYFTINFGGKLIPFGNATPTSNALDNLKKWLGEPEGAIDVDEL